METTEDPLLRRVPRWVVALIVLAVGASLAPGAGPVAAAEVRVITLPIQADQVTKVHWSDTYGAPRGGGRLPLNAREGRGRKRTAHDFA